MLRPCFVDESVEIMWEQDDRFIDKIFSPIEMPNENVDLNVH